MLRLITRTPSNNRLNDKFPSFCIDVVIVVIAITTFATAPPNHGTLISNHMQNNIRLKSIIYIIAGEKPKFKY